ncbi:DUF3772 domain-containing protein [Methylobacterium tarhaniae]|uniref:DUF3772 domain-containing protein n=1 Tax=Methylobacterium tarhaniae TaxID=1187852 RepID=UPI0009FB66EC|nr:DUF3772 domain-containing protein [Methylobacterium tarhaniae]
MRVPSSLKSHAPGHARLSARAARRLTLPPLLIVLLSIWLALPAAAQTGGLVPETRQLLRETEEALPRIEQDYAGALRARNAIEPLREALRARLQQLERRQRDLDQQVARLGPKPAWDETEAVAAQRRELAALQAAFEAEYRPVLLAAQQSEQMWHRLTEIRRTLFAKRLTMNVASILDPIFWRDVATVELPRFAVQTEQLLRSWADYVSLAMSCLAVAVAVLIVTTLDQLLGRGQASQTRAGAALAAMLGLSHHAIDLAGVALSGLTRLAVIVTTGLIVLAPWGLEYGDVNPFGDFAAWFATTDLRSGLGTFGFALLAFVLGIVGTKLVVDWMDTALLPRTSLDPSLRHSIRTVLGYAGFAVTALGALSLMGINAQNIAVIAGALSIGIGFGLQSIVGNFVSGLILLAERPVRVGDVVVIKGEEGRVQRISVRSTVIGTFQQASVVIPNSDLIASVVRNRNLANANLELRFTLVLDHDADVARADAVVVTAAEGHANVLKTPKPRVLFVRITEIGQELEVRCSADRFENKRQVRSDLHHRIAEAFRQEGLRFARYPHAMAALSTSAQAEDTD